MIIADHRLTQIRNVVFRATIRALTREFPEEDGRKALVRAMVMDLLEIYLKELVDRVVPKVLSPDEYYHAPIVLGCDPAQGADISTIITVDPLDIEAT